MGVAHQDVNCPGETIAMTDSAITFPNSGNTGDCIGDGVRSQKKDPSKYTLDINSDGSLTFHSDGYPDMKLTKKSFAVAAPSGSYEGSVPFIIDITMDIKSATSADVDINIKVAHQDVIHHHHHHHHHRHRHHHHPPHPPPPPPPPFAH